MSSTEPARGSSPWEPILGPLRDALGGPLVVHLSSNGVRGDSRILKSAQTSQAAGYPSILVGFNLTQELEAFEIEGVPVVLVPLGLSKVISTHPAPAIRSFEDRWRSASRALSLRRAARGLKSARQLSDVKGAVGAARAATGSPTWATIRPATAPMMAGFMEALEVLSPRIVQSHDTQPLAAAVGYAASARLRGNAVWTVYDAHECCIRLLESYPTTPNYQLMAQVEREFIHDADDVITVSAEIAALLQESYGLSTRPGVVTNAPTSVRDLNAPSLRETIGLADDVPLAVYSGGIAPERGVGTAVHALTMLPGVHLAVVCPSLKPQAMEVYQLAVRLGVQDRLHMTSYVPPAQLTQYLSSADVGLIPRKPGGHLDLSLPTKYREYLHAGLPLVVSRNAAMAREVHRTGVGLHFHCTSVDGLALQVSRVLADPQKYTSRITPELLDEYSWERQAVVLTKIYRRVLGDASAGPAFVGTEVKTALLQITPDQEAGPDEPTPTTGAVLWNPARKNIRLGIGPQNSAGQAYYLAEAVRRHADLDAESFGPRSDLATGPHRATRRLDDHTNAASGTELGLLVTRYTHLLVESYRPVVGSLIGSGLAEELTVLRRHIRDIGLVATGTDIRDPERHMDRLAGSYFRVMDPDWVANQHELTRRNRETAHEHDGALFVSTPDLLLDLPEAVWLPAVVDIGAWASLRPSARGPRPRVLHLLGQENPVIKGSDVIVPVLDSLEAEGLIEVVRSEPVKHDEVSALMERADIVIDQVRTGSYGVTAIEAMAAGRVVVGHVAEDVRALVSDEIPVFDAPADGFEARFRSLLADSQTMERLATDAPGFARRWHDGRKAAVVLTEFIDGTTARSEEELPQSVDLVASSR